MPRKTDPLEMLRTHEARTEEFEKKGAALREAAALHLGQQIMKAGIDTWSSASFDQVVAGLARLGETESVKRLGQTKQAVAAE